MKKIFIYLLVAGFIVALLFPYLKGGSGDDTIPVKFGFEANLAVKQGENLPIPLVVDGDLKTLHLKFNGKTVKTWNSPTGKISFVLPISETPVGAYSVEFDGYTTDGNTTHDQRLIRILSDVTPEKWTAEVVNSYPHNATSFTQGLEFYNGSLFEGTGDPNQKGETIVGEIDLKSGEILRKMGLDASHFGEGITIMNDKIYQLTWKNGKCLIYKVDNLENVGEFSYTGEGWGLCNDGKNLIMSDGSERLYFRDAKNFALLKTMEVYTDAGPVVRLNELEYHDGLIYANVWMTDDVVAIDAKSGKVIAIIDARQVSLTGKGNGDVLNGIAYNKKTNSWYMTGKNWSKLFEVKFSKPSV